LKKGGKHFEENGEPEIIIDSVISVGKTKEEAEANLNEELRRKE